MSLSNQSSESNPSKRFFQWKAGSGKLVYWDGEAKQEKAVKRPFKFAVLDELHTVSGFSEQENTGIWANEVKNLGEENIVVRAGAKELASGKYSEIKDSVKAKGGKYTKSVYIATELDGLLSIANIKFSGAAFGAWMDFSKLGSIYGNWTIIEEATKEGKKGATKFLMPKFSPELMDDAERAAAVELDKQLQSFLASKRTAPVQEEKTTDTIVTADDFEEDKPIDLSSIPF